MKSPLAEHARCHPGLRVIEGRFTVIEQAIGTPTGRVHSVRFLQGFIEELKGNGFIAAALERSGQRDAAVAPLQPVEAEA